MRTLLLLVATFCFLWSGTYCLSADWPQYRSDAARSGSTPEVLPERLSLHWTHHSRLAPARAWPRSKRLAFDRAFRLVVNGGLLFFGSSADGKVRALDIETGAERWSFFTAGPIRFAPVAWRDRVFVGSDDGYLYCLAAADGALMWRRRSGPDESKVLGNGQVISRWPVRGGPVLRDSKLYFTAGIWPSEGIYIHALDPLTGKEIWCNDTSGSIYMAQPHGGANAESGVIAQGHLAASDTLLVVPTGRAVPAVFSATDGTFKYFHLQRYGQRGGAEVMLAGRGLFCGGGVFEAATGNLLQALGGEVTTAAPDVVVRGSAGTISTHAWLEVEKKDRKGQPYRQWTLREKTSHGLMSGREKSTAPVSSLVVTGSMVVAATGMTIHGLDLDAGKRAWAFAVDGAAADLAVASNRLFVSTDKGIIHCFGRQGERAPVIVEPAPPGQDPQSERAITAADEIVRLAGITRGLCIDLGSGDGSLALALARKTNMQIVAIESTPSRVAAIRSMLESCGVHGNRVMVIEADLEATGLPPQIANLLVSGRSLETGVEGVHAGELGRLLRPYGGVACVGLPGAMKKTVGGTIAGAGSWTHQYADAANTASSRDTIVRGPFRVHWFRDGQQEMTQRHGRGPAPLYKDGRLFSEGLDSLVAVDAYNGHFLWEFPFPGILRAYHGDHLMGTAGTGSNYCIAGDSVYVRTGASCYRIDAATGKRLDRFDIKTARGKTPPVWGFLACEDGVLIGSIADTEHIVTYRYLPGGDMKKQYTESSQLFALDARSGKLLWKYQAEHSIRHNAIAIGGGTIHFIDRPLALFDRRRKDPPAEHPGGTLIAAKLRTGKKVWSSDENIWGTMLILSVEHDALMMGYQMTRFKLASERGGKLAAFRATSGDRLWDRDKISYSTRPVLVDRSIYALGGAWDLLGGEDRPFNLKKSYGCGQISGSRHMLFYRSATLGYFDLEKNDRNQDYGGIRPGCWINAIPAGGLLLMPDASAGCKCSYLIQSWVALGPASETAAGK